MPQSKLLRHGPLLPVRQSILSDENNYSVINLQPGAVVRKRTDKYFLFTRMLMSRKIQIVSVGLAIFGVYNIWAAIKYGQPLYLLPGAACVLTSTGLWFQKPWSRFAVYTVCILIILDSLFFLLSAIMSLPYVLLADAAAMLVSRLLLVAVFIWFMVVTFRFFRSAKKKNLTTR